MANEEARSGGPKDPDLRERARQRLGDAPTDTSGSSEADLKTLVTELELHQEELRIQNEELAAAQEEASTARDRYRDLFERAPVAYLLVDRRGRIGEANLPAEELLGVGRAKLEGSELTTFVAAGSQDDWFRLRRSLAPAMARRTAELTLAGTGDHQRAVRIETVAEPDTDPADPRFRCALVDITDLRETERALQAERDKLEARVAERTRALEALRDHRERLLNSLAEGVFGVDTAGRFTFLNPAAVRLFGFSGQAAVLGQSSHRLTHHTDAEGSPYPESACPIYRVMATGEPLEAWQDRFWRADGTPFPVEVYASPITDGGNNGDGVGGAVVAFNDISERQARQRRLRQAAMVFRNARDGLMITDADACILEVNPAVTDITGYTAAELIGQTPALFQSGHHGPAFYEAMWAHLRQTGSWSGEVWDRRKDGEVRAKWLTITAVTDDRGEPTHYVAVFSDIDELKRYQHELEHQAYHDALTDLPNRALFEDRLGHALQRSHREGQRVAVAFFDLDHFKDINDSLGHAAGDQLLQGIADRAAGILREPDTLARLGGDELTVCLEGITATEDAVATAQRLQAVLAEPFELAGRSVRLTISVGLSLYPDDGTTTEDLVRHADSALYQAKEAGRNTIRLYNAALTAKADERLKLGEQLKTALAEDELILHYQPQRELATGELVGLEVLVRWAHPEEGLLGPDRFIPLAEELGHIHALGNRVLDAACRQGRRWLDAGHDPGRLAVNVSAQQVAEGDLAERVREALAASGFPADRLELEITESALMTPSDDVLAGLEALRELGVTLAVDDFGTGYSSLLYLQRLPVARLKIDKGFVQAMLTSPETRGIVRAILAMARTLGLAVVAEGVETVEQRAALLEDGAGVEQGFLYARPQPADVVTDRLPPCPRRSGGRRMNRQTDRG